MATAVGIAGENPEPQWQYDSQQPDYGGILSTTAEEGNVYVSKDTRMNSK